MQHEQFSVVVREAEFTDRSGVWRTDGSRASGEVQRRGAAPEARHSAADCPTPSSPAERADLEETARPRLCVDGLTPNEFPTLTDAADSLVAPGGERRITR